ncbi:ribosome assembly factor SBDS [Candidatus Micrarchaeota archaeon]|nr:ribosome assembly factor SBDS [Candidatus Micrarchaeota archaeon]
MVSLDKAIIASYDREGEHFELFLDPDNAYLYLEGSKKDLKNILVVDEVFEDAKKGERHKAEAIKKAFGTTDIFEILKIMLEKGEVQLTTEQKRKKLEETRKKILAIICMEAIDARTKAPIPIQRLENALEQVRIHIDPFKDPKEQVPGIVKLLLPLIPIKFEKVNIAVKVPAAHAHRCYGTLKSYGIKKEQWLGDGSLVVMLEIPAGMQGELFDKLNKLTAGQIETKIIDR